MPVEVSISEGPLPTATPRRMECVGEVGGVTVFEGIVRALESGQQIPALLYAAYEPMAQNMLARIGEDLLAKYKLVGMRVEHSKGRVAVGECSFRLTIWSKHRKEALAAADEFIDRLKQDVPIWKSVAES